MRNVFCVFSSSLTSVVHWTSFEIFWMKFLFVFDCKSCKWLLFLVHLSQFALTDPHFDTVTIIDAIKQICWYSMLPFWEVRTEMFSHVMSHKIHSIANQISASVSCRRREKRQKKKLSFLLFSSLIVLHNFIAAI